jgi:hypothetical protein
MNARTFVPVLVFATIFPALAEDPPPKLDTSITTESSSAGQTRYSDRRTNPLTRKSEPSGLRIGKRRIPISSPILEGLIPRRSPPGSSVGKRMLNLPVVRLLVPMRMPEPPQSGRYIKWREPSTQPWASIAGGTPASEPTGWATP